MIPHLLLVAGPATGCSDIDKKADPNALKLQDPGQCTVAKQGSDSVGVVAGLHQEETVTAIITIRHPSELKPA